MATLSPTITVTFDMSLRLSEVEWRALDALVGYGTDSFIEVFYAKLGKAYMEPHEPGLRSLFDTIGKNAPAFIRQVDDTRRAAGLGSRARLAALPKGEDWGADLLKQQAAENVRLHQELKAWEGTGARKTELEGHVRALLDAARDAGWSGGEVTTFIRELGKAQQPLYEDAAAARITELETALREANAIAKRCGEQAKHITRLERVRRLENERNAAECHELRKQLADAEANITLKNATIARLESGSPG